MIRLEPVTPDNHVAVRKLRVRPDQTHLVATVEASLADAYVWQDALFRAAFQDDVAVGYVLIFPFTRDGSALINIVRLMIDADFQGRGLGGALLDVTLDWIGGLQPRVARVRVSTLRENAVALRLYESRGFRTAGVEAGEIALYREL